MSSEALICDTQWCFTTKYINVTYSNGSVVSYVAGLEMDLLRVVLQQMNMTFVHVPNLEGFVTEKE